ncbi:hypothetical protein [Romboutsia sp. Marseille-P6047]|uniref:hypothetical protein n=1 Tax=Romboutsia sp. Marseille-P6047 TaxID=2161817 RepID=UPI000F04D53B|nr:hypothetical protein [Romboutsia sp. Marseille-P6047]
MDKFDIDMPNNLEIRKEISFILDEGLEKKESFYSYVKNMYQKIGFKNLFHDFTELTFIGILLVSILAYGVVSIRHNYFISQERIYTFIFIISPLYYLLTNIFSFVNVIENNTFDIEMICKYNIHQVSALRMIVFSVISMLLSSVFILGLYNQINLLKGMMIGITSIFLFSAILLYSIVKVKNVLVKYIVVISWIISNATLLILSEDIYFVFLETIPSVVYLLVTIASMWVYIKNIKILSRYNKTYDSNTI